MMIIVMENNGDIIDSLDMPDTPEMAIDVTDGYTNRKIRRIVRTQLAPSGFNSRDDRDRFEAYGGLKPY